MGHTELSFYCYIFIYFPLNCQCLAQLVPIDLFKQVPPRLQYIGLCRTEKYQSKNARGLDEKAINK